MKIVHIIYLVIIAYLLGSIPFGLIVGKLIRKTDIRQFGSGNLGFTNAVRVLGWKVGSLVLIGDMGKGALAAYLGLRFLGSHEAGFLVGIVAVLGHSFPVFAGFKGGKGIATGGGVYLVVFPLLFALGISTFCLVLLLSRYVSLSSLTAATVLAVGGTIYGYRGFLLLVIWLITIFVFYTHRGNIKRLLAGEERKIEFKRKK